VNLLSIPRIMPLVLSTGLALQGCVSTYTVPTGTPPRGEWSVERIACDVLYDEDSDVALPPVGIYVMNGDGSERTEIGQGQLPTWSPSGGKLAVIDRYFNTLSLLDLDTGHIASILESDRDLGKPAWSPDGRTIAVVLGNSDIWLLDSDGSNLRELAGPIIGPGVSRPTWSPNGEKIAFSLPRRGVDDGSDIYVMDKDGSNVTRLTDGTGRDFGPLWSPVEDMIAFYSHAEGEGHIVLMNADGSQQRRIGIGDPYAWSPDGSRIYFGIPGDEALWTMNSDGSSRTRLFELDCENPVWSPVIEG
jgi:Tol biopolymer transport system component